jgi:hypothetical protein
MNLNNVMQTCDKRKRKQMWKSGGTTHAKGGHDERN